MRSITACYDPNIDEFLLIMTLGWKLSPDCRERLLARFAPHYERVVADHVTLQPPGPNDDDLPAPVADAAIVGRADDEAGVEAYVVAIAGGTARPDGSIWHVTWSLGPDRQAKESNMVIAECGWASIEPVALDLVPARW